MTGAITGCDLSSSVIHASLDEPARCACHPERSEGSALCVGETSLRWPDPSASPQDDKTRNVHDLGRETRVMFQFVQQSKTENGPAPRFSLLALV